MLKEAHILFKNNVFNFSFISLRLKALGASLMMGIRIWHFIKIKGKYSFAEMC